MLAACDEIYCKWTISTDKPGNHSLHVIFSSLDAFKGRQQPIPLSSSITQPLLSSLDARNESESVNGGAAKTMFLMATAVKSMTR